MLFKKVFKVSIITGVILFAVFGGKSMAEGFEAVYEVDTQKYDIKSPREVCKLQAVSNIEADRSFGDLTKGIFELKKIQTKDVFTFEVKGDMIVINKTNKTLTHYKDNAIVGKYPLALGVRSHQTPTMKTKVVSKAINPYWGGMNGKYKPQRGGSPTNPLGKRWMGIGGMYGIHGNNNQDSIGKYASHGCIRMFNEQVEHLFNLIPVGTPVWVGNADDLKKWGITQNKAVKIEEKTDNIVLEQNKDVVVNNNEGK